MRSRGSPVNLLPSFQPPVVAVTVNYGNVSPETMESTVTRPIENAVARVSGIDYLQSNSFQGQTVVRAQFKFGTDINVATNDIQQQVARSPLAAAERPEPAADRIQKADPNAAPVVRFYVTDRRARSAISPTSSRTTSPTSSPPSRASAA